MHDTRRMVRTSLIVLALVLIGVYGYYESRAFLGGPQIMLETPENGERFLEPVIVVSGTAKTISEITLNGRPIFIDEEGRFEERLVLAPGYTKITLTAKDRFGNTTEALREVTYAGGFSKPAEDIGTTTEDLPDTSATSS